ncbi:hypothetical protein OESDEN_14234 [Oesophagostomum dentatum]|uniref:Uncharacterized protein n=1 Tax=Oesophagostomum dentatum TaxID=61180 RepID=A0A0B1SL20_OESDE|nr:hypothetical protein OESDEN_14234 [Oesophagostomum dentatum]
MMAQTPLGAEEESDRPLRSLEPSRSRRSPTRYSTSSIVSAAESYRFLVLMGRISAQERAPEDGLLTENR